MRYLRLGINIQMILNAGCMYFLAPVKLDLFHESYLINYHS